MAEARGLQKRRRGAHPVAHHTLSREGWQSSKEPALPSEELRRGAV